MLDQLRFRNRFENVDDFVEVDSFDNSHLEKDLRSKHQDLFGLQFLQNHQAVVVLLNFKNLNMGDLVIQNLFGI